MQNILSALCLMCMLIFGLSEASSGANCPVKTRSNKCCVFPFVYKGATYTSCITVKSSTAWCSHTPNYDRDGSYDYCVGLEAMLTVDDQAFVYGNGQNLGRDNGVWNRAQSYMFSLDIQVVAVYARNNGGPGRFMAKFGNGIQTDASWKCTTKGYSNWQKIDYDDSEWPIAVLHGANGNTVSGIPSDVQWIGVKDPNARSFYCRRRISIKPQMPPVAGSYHHLGCYRDQSSRALPVKLSDFPNRPDIVQLCGKLAVSKGYRTFSIQVARECWSGPQADKTYSKYGQTDNCVNGKGSSWANDVYTVDGCTSALGLQSGYIENEAMTASSNWDAQHMSWRARLHMVKQGSFIGSWCTRTNDVRQWLQVDFGRSTRITGVATQGRQDYDQWVKSYSLSYSHDRTTFTPYRINGREKVFGGNRDRNTMVRNGVSPSIEGQYVRIHPKTWHGHISMRAEFYGCFMVCKVDVGILMDESGSVNAQDWEREKNFVKDLVGHFQLGRDFAQFGVISFSTYAHMDIFLNSYVDVKSFRRAVDGIRQARGWTYTNKALDLAYSQLFSTSRGARGHVAKVLIVITDGISTGGLHILKAPIKRLKDSSVNIISIGVGSKINKNELEMMASDPSRSHVYYVSNMEQLKSLIRSISSSSCSTFSCRYVTCTYEAWGAWSKSCGKGVTRTQRLSKVNTLTIERQGGCSGLKQTCERQRSETKDLNCPCRYVTCSWNQWGAWSATCGRMTRQRTSKVTQHSVTRPGNCNGLETSCPMPETKSIYISCCKAEVGIIMDESGSVSAPDFEREKDFIVEMANGFGNYGPSGIQMGIITFSTYAHMDIRLNQYRNKADFIRAVRGIRQARGWTYSAKALNLARTQLFQAGNGARKGVSKILVILTDGVSTSGMNSLREPTRLLKAGHVNIFTIGIGNRINKAELEFMASDPVPSHVFYVASMQQLPTLLHRISTSSCQAYTCKYVTCDYSAWSAWSASCGKGMRRTRRLSKENEHTTQQQGGCSGLTTTCEQHKTETKDMNCPCRYVTCSWNDWGAWSASCGRMTRQRTSKVTQHSVTRPDNCNGLQTSCPAPQTQAMTRSCCKADVALLLDESGSVTDADFTREKDFVALMADGFDNFGPAGIQMGVITFSTGTRLRIKLNQYKDSGSFMKNIKAIVQNGGWTYTNLALNQAREEMFTAAGGARSGVTKILLIITDGSSTGGMDSLREPIRKLREKSINIFSVGVGRRTVRQELEFMASDPKASHMFSVMKMQELPTLLDRLATSTCQMYTCKYVTCDYGAWSAWSASCGKGMRRTRRLSKENEHTTQQQGGCSGLTTTCEEHKTETKDMNCPCRYVSCAWAAWSDWSATCGASTRRRTSQTTEHIVNRPSCSGLQTSCPAPQTQKRTTNCVCKSVKCTWNVWSAWSSTCGAAKRTRTIKTTAVVVNRPHCAGLPQACTQKPEAESRTTDCNCSSVQCKWNAWSGWSASCGTATRSRTIQTIRVTVKHPSCASLPQTCTQRPEAESRKVLCVCNTVRCDMNAWSAWTATCGIATRTRTVRTTRITVQRFDCAGLPQTCSQPPETEKRKTDCPCRAVQCTLEDWSEWSASCGIATRTRKIKTKHIIVNRPDCSGLPQKCTNPPQREQRKKMCSCPTVTCEWNPWEAWSATCGSATRRRTIKTIKKTVQALSCDGLPIKCTEHPQTEKRSTLCSCNMVNCVWNDWSAWSGSCGTTTRTRTIKTVKVVVQKPSCESLTQTCPQAPESQSREVMCSCPTVNCTWNAWDDWSATCGVATRRRTIKTTKVTVQKLSCDGFPQACSQPPQTENRKTMCDCQSVKCTWNDWSGWSASCGAATRRRTINTTQVTVKHTDCSAVPNTCDQKPETQRRNTLCNCNTVNCTWEPWGNWSGDCGLVKRQRKSVQTSVVVQKETCDGLPTKCPQQPEEETNKLPDCQECFTVNCRYGDWAPWSATCGPATRRRYQIVDEVFVKRASCDNLPMECTGDYVQEQKRNTPTCPPTTAPPPTPTTA